MSSGSTLPTSEKPPIVDPKCWDGCVESLANRFKCENITTEKTAQVAAILLVIIASLIFVSALMVQYPTAAKTFFTIFGLGGIAALVTMVVAIVKYCKENDVQSPSIKRLFGFGGDEAKKESAAPGAEAAK